MLIKAICLTHLLFAPASAALTLPLSVVPSLTLPSSAQGPSPAEGRYTTNGPPNPTTPGPPTPREVLCYSTGKVGPPINPPDCATVLNDILLRLPDPFCLREFSSGHYQISPGIFLPARWAFGTCAVFVRASSKYSIQYLRIFDIAMTANRILSECTKGPFGKRPKGGISGIGSLVEGFHVVVAANVDSDKDLRNELVFHKSENMERRTIERAR